MAAFPSIRTPTRAGWRGASPDGVRRTQMDAGPPKRRRESTAVGAIERFSFKLSDADAATLEAFYAANKAGRHTWTHPVWGAVEVAFNRAPDWSEQGPWRIADVELEVFR